MLFLGIDQHARKLTIFLMFRSPKVNLTASPWLT